MDWLLDIWNWTREARNLGDPLVVASAAGTVVFSVIEAAGLHMQRRKISAGQSDESLSVKFFMYALWIFWTLFVFGIFERSASVMFNGLLNGIMCAPLLLALRKYHEFSNTEKRLFFAFALMPVLMVFLPWKNILFVLFSLGTIAMFLDQPLQIARKESAGVVSGSLLLIYFMSEIFWLALAFKFNIIALEIICCLSIPILFMTILIWSLYKFIPVK